MTSPQNLRFPFLWLLSQQPPYVFHFHFCFRDLHTLQTHAVLSDLEHGLKSNDFSGRLFENTYASHLTYLQSFRKNNRNAFHKLMHGLYVSAMFVCFFIIVL